MDIDAKAWIKAILSLDKFDQEYWDSYSHSIIKIISRLRNHKYNFVLPVIESKESDIYKSWIFYLESISYEQHGEIIEAIKLLRLSANLGNPYAMILFIKERYKIDDEHTNTCIYNAYKLGHPTGIIQYILSYMDNYTDQSNRERKILEDLSKLPRHDNLDNLDEENYSDLAKIYIFLDLLNPRADYNDYILYYKVKAGELKYYEDLSGNSWRIINLIVGNFHKNNEIKELKETIAKLKLLKQLDFSSLISGGVGEYL